MTQSEALEELKDLVSWEAEPALSEAVLLRCLAKNLRYKAWESETVYAVGDRVAANGRLYICMVAGVSGENAPFPTNGAHNVFSPCFYWDGAVRWEDAGAAFKDNYDMGGAARAAWLMKAAKDSELVDMSDRDTKIMLSGRREFALKQAARYTAIWVV